MYVTGQWFSLCMLVCSINKTDHSDITEILLNLMKVILNTLTLPPKICSVMSGWEIYPTCETRYKCFIITSIHLIFSFNIHKIKKNLNICELFYILKIHQTLVTSHSVICYGYVFPHELCTVFLCLLNALVHRMHPLSSPKNLGEILVPIYRTQGDSVKHSGQKSSFKRQNTAYHRSRIC